MDRGAADAQVLTPKASKGGTKAKTKAEVAALANAKSEALAAESARRLLAPEWNAARVACLHNAKHIQDAGGQGRVLPHLLAEVRTLVSEVKAGDLSSVEAMLATQALAMQAMFVGLAERAQTQQSLDALRDLSNLAMRAQNQSRATLETLAGLRQPSFVVTRTANVVNGPVQVNQTAVAAPVRADAPFRENEVMGGQHEPRRIVDARASGQTVASHPPMEAVAVGHRP